MKRLFSIVLVNITFIFMVIFIIEFVSYKKLLTIFPCEISTFKFLSFYKAKSFEKDLSIRFPLNNKNLFSFKYYGQNYRNTPPQAIIVFGCSMAYGVGLNENQTFAYKISKKLKRPVYNFAYPGGGLNQIYYLLQYSKFKQSIKKEPEFILYFYNPDHIRRMIMRVTPTFKDEMEIFYKIKNKKLLQKNPLILENSYFYSFLIYNYITSIGYNKYIEQLFSLYLLSIDKEIKTLFPNSKFVIVKFSSEFDFENNILKNYNVIDIPKLTKIEVMDINTRSKWCIDNDFHPNEKYWDSLIPTIANELTKI